MNAIERALHSDERVRHDAGAARKTICYPFAGDSIGGSHISLLGLLERLDPARYRVLIVPERPGGRIAELFSEFEQLADPFATGRSLVPGEAFNLGKYLGTVTGAMPRAKFLREHGVDLVHSNDGRTHATWALSARLAGLPLVWHHRADPDAMGLRFLAPLLASRVLTVSQFSLPRRGIWSAQRKAEVVFSPFDTSITVDRTAVRERLIEEQDLPRDALLLGYFGSIVPRKRPLLFVDTIAQLRQRLDRPVYGLVFGEPKIAEMGRALETRIRDTGMQNAVRVMGFRKPGHEFIGACDQLLVPAIGEPLGRTLVEAMLVGTPVVATRSGGNPEALADGAGVLVEPESAAALADGVIGLIDNARQTRLMTQRAMKTACDRFGVERHAASVSAVYERLLR